MSCCIDNKPDTQQIIIKEQHKTLYEIYYDKDKVFVFDFVDNRIIKGREAAELITVLNRKGGFSG